MTEMVVVVEGVRDLAEALGYARATIDRELPKAMNKTANRTRTRVSKTVRELVRFPARYLGPSAGNLSVSERASPSKLTITISGRDRPTSLARFRVGRTPAEPALRVTPGGPATRIPRSFLINLRRGQKSPKQLAAAGEDPNVGLAVRSEGKPLGSWKPIEMSPGLWLLYGPSVDQVLMGDGMRGAFAQNEEDALDFLEAEFWRLLAL